MTGKSGAPATTTGAPSNTTAYEQMVPPAVKGPWEPAEPLDESLPSEWLEAIRYRRVARLVVRDEGRSRGERVLAIVKLAEQARARAADPWLCQREVARESLAFIETGRSKIPPAGGDAVVRALRILLSKQLDRCPTCHRSLPPEETLDRWDAAASVALLEYAASEKAIGA